MHPSRLALLLPFAFVVASASCGGRPTSTDRRTIVDSRDTDDPRSLDPALSTDVPTGRAAGYLFDGLTAFTPDARVVPALAERWETSPDGLTYVFHLRRGVKFHDGTTFRAQDVVRSWGRVLDPAVRGGRGWPLYPIAGAEDYADGKAKGVRGLAVRDDSTLVVTLKEPFAIFPKLLAMPVAAIVPQNVPENFGEHPVGTGPWKFVEWKHDDYLLFARNERYWGGAPPADSLRARIISEPSTAVAEFESGNVDVVLIPEGESRAYEEDELRKPMLQSAPALVLVYVAMNVNRGPLKDRRVRQAINHALDTEKVIEILVSGRGQRAAGVIPPTLEGADPSRKPYAFDTLRARQLVREAGYPNGVDVQLWVGSNPTYLRVAQTIQAYLQKANIRVKIVQRESAAARGAARAGETDLFLKDWYADYPDAENFLYPLLHSKNEGVGGNVSFFRNPQFDAIVDRARREPNDTARIALYRQADSLAFVEAPMLFLYFDRLILGVQPWIEGFKVPTIFNGQRWTDVRIRHSKEQ